MKKAILILVGAGLVVLLLLMVQRGKPSDSGSDQPVRTEDESEVSNPEISSVNTSRAVTIQPEVSEAVVTLVGEVADYQTRIKAMRELGYEIAPHELEALMRFLAVPMPEDAKLRPLSYNAIRNDVMDILLRQKRLPEGIGELLTGVYHDPNHDVMWRNYCIQFMEPFYEKVAAVASPESPNEESTGQAGKPASHEELTNIQEALWSALDERDNSNAGTALLALDKLSRNHAEFDRLEISSAMIELACDEQASLANRVTALRLCGERGNMDALETARTLAEHGKTTMLRCAAIATLGELGVEEDLDLLRTYAESSDKRIQQIAQTTLQKRDSK